MADLICKADPDMDPCFGCVFNNHCIAPDPGEPAIEYPPLFEMEPGQ